MKRRSNQHQQVHTPVLREVRAEVFTLVDSKGKTRASMTVLEDGPQKGAVVFSILNGNGADRLRIVVGKNDEEVSITIRTPSETLVRRETTLSPETQVDRISLGFKAQKGLNRGERLRPPYFSFRDGQGVQRVLLELRAGDNGPCLSFQESEDRHARCKRSRMGDYFFECVDGDQYASLMPSGPFSHLWPAPRKRKRP